jgi:hypothetical protein
LQSLDAALQVALAALDESVRQATTREWAAQLVRHGTQLSDELLMVAAPDNALAVTGGS